MATKADLEDEVKQWLQSGLEAEHLKDLSVKIVGNSEKGDGYLGDIVFVDVSGITEDELPREYHLVLKCSKRSEVLRVKSPVKEIFMNEICIYETVIPAFVQFEKEQGIENYFNSVPKFYGKYISDSMEVLIFENLKKRGYDLWDRRKPLTRKHINLVTSQYGHFHAISVAMNDQQPEKLEVLRLPIENAFKQTDEHTQETYSMFKTSVEEVYNLLKDDLDESTLLKWKNFKQQIKPAFEELDTSRVKVISHGDCWNNNFMYLCENGEKEFPQKVAILDWQVSRFSTPIMDLSYFLFTCISEEDLLDMEEILEHYYKSFATHLEELGSQPSILYPYEEFLEDWKKHCRFGVVLSSLLLKICTTEKDEVIDIAESAEQGKTFMSSFTYEIKNKESFKNRIRPVVKYVADRDLI